MVVFSPATIDILQTPSKFSLRKMVPASARSHFKNCQPAQVRPAERIFCRADPLGTPDITTAVTRYLIAGQKENNEHSRVAARP